MQRRSPDQKPEAARQASLLRVFCVCAVAVVALFLGYEVVERTWLGGADPRLLHMLHVVRGLSAGAIAAVLATILIVRQLGSRTLGEASLPPLARPWPRRLQHVRVRTKIVVPMVMLAVGPATLLGTFMISSMRDFLRQSAIEDLEFETSSKAQAIRGFLQTVQQDLSFLAQGKTIRHLADAEAVEPAARASSQQVAALREDVEREFLVFSQGKRAYYQVRYLDRNGHEVVRLNVEEGQPLAVPVELLQDKSDRYYVTEAFALHPNQIYVSPMDLNVEHGKLESPLRGVVRYATTVSGTDGLARGLLVINVYADYLLSLIGPLPPQTEAWLVDKGATYGGTSGGTYLGYVGHSGERSELYALSKRRKLSEDFAGEEAAAILQRKVLGVNTTEDGLA